MVKAGADGRTVKLRDVARIELGALAYTTNSFLLRKSAVALLETQRALRQRAPADLDLLWYLWTGPLSPLFGKDKMATFETYFIAEPESHRETKNAYFEWIHDPDFCRRVCAELGVEPRRGLIVNGHVPVRVEKGESPLKKSGLAQSERKGGFTTYCLEKSVRRDLSRMSQIALRLAEKDPGNC